MRRHFLGGLAIGGAALLVSLPAGANGRFPASNQFVFSPTDKNLIVLRTTYGLLPTRDGGAHWSYLCEDALGLGAAPYADPAVTLTRSNALVSGAALGLDVSTDVGCSWQCAGGALAGQVIVDVARRPNDPRSVVAITGTYVRADASGSSTYSQVFETTDDGATWAPIGAPIPPDVEVATIDVAASDPDRLYASGTRGYGPARRALLFVSRDKGATWDERDLGAAFDPTVEDQAFIGAVDPTNADRVYLRSSGLATGGKSRLTVTANAGQSFTTAYSFDVPAARLGVTGEMQGLALSPDGTKVYIGSQEDGLFVAAASELAFRKVSSIHVRCLATRDGELWACSDAVSGFVAGVSTDDGATFTPKMRLVTSLSGPPACPAGGPLACGSSVGVEACGAAFDTFCEQNNVGDEKCGTDAGAPATPASPANANGGGGGGGCSSSGSPGAWSPLAALVLGAIGWRGRRAAQRNA